MTDPVSPRESLIERLNLHAARLIQVAEAFRLQGPLVGLIDQAADEMREAADALSVAEAVNKIQKETLVISLRSGAYSAEARAIAAEADRDAYKVSFETSWNECVRLRALLVAAEERIEAVRALHVEVEDMAKVFAQMTAAERKARNRCQPGQEAADNARAAFVAHGSPMRCRECNKPAPCSTVAALDAPLDTKERCKEYPDIVLNEMRCELVGFYHRHVPLDTKEARSAERRFSYRCRACGWAGLHTAAEYAEHVCPSEVSGKDQP